MNRRRDFLSLAAGAVGAGTVPAVAAKTERVVQNGTGAGPHPDAELIRVCAKHAVNTAAYNRDGGFLEFEDDPLWLAYVETRDFIAAATPRTLAGMQAKALAAKAEAATPDGDESPEGSPAADWAWDLVNDLLDMRPGTDAEGRTWS